MCRIAKQLSVLSALLLLAAGSVVASPLNPSFESQTHGTMPNGVSTSLHEEWGMPDDWIWRHQGATNGHGIRADYAPFGVQVGWSSDGDWSLYMFASTAGQHEKGDFIEFYQTVDLTGLSQLLFDALLKGGTYTHTYLAIDSQKLWVAQQAGNYFDIALDISSYSGTHEIQLGIEVSQAFEASADGWSYFDHLRAVPLSNTLLLFALALGALVWSRRRRGDQISQLLNS